MCHLLIPALLSGPVDRQLSGGEDWRGGALLSLGLVPGRHGLSAPGAGGRHLGRPKPLFWHNWTYRSRSAGPRVRVVAACTALTRLAPLADLSAKSGEVYPVRVAQRGSRSNCRRTTTQRIQGAPNCPTRDPPSPPVSVHAVRIAARAVHSHGIGDIKPAPTSSCRWTPMPHHRLGRGGTLDGVHRLARGVLRRLNTHLRPLLARRRSVPHPGASDRRRPHHRALHGAKAAMEMAC